MDSTRTFAADFPAVRSQASRRRWRMTAGAVAMGVVLFAWPLHAHATVVYSQPPAASGPLLQSSWWTPDGSDYDQYVWDAFILQASTSVTEIRWRGAYARSGQLVEFTVAIYPSIPAGIQPDVVHPPLVEYATGGNAGETPAGTVGGVPVYDYRFTLPHAFQATAGTKYWVQIEASQNGIPDWSLVTGTGGDGSYFRRIAGVGDFVYQTVPGDSSFAIVAPGPDVDTPTPTPTATPTVTPTPTSPPTATPVPCLGDCGGDGQVTVDDIVVMVNIANATLPISACPAADPNHTGTVTVDQIIVAVNNALNGCPH